MTNNTLFETATRSKFRFESAKGLLSTEQLWDLPLTGTTSLDSVAKEVNRQLKAVAEESFVQTQVGAQEKLLVTKLELVKHIIAVRLAEREVAAQAREKAAKKQQILELLAEKDNEALKGKSKEELLKELEAL